MLLAHRCSPSPTVGGPARATTVGGPGTPASCCRPPVEAGTVARVLRFRAGPAPRERGGRRWRGRPPSSVPRGPTPRPPRSRRNWQASTRARTARTRPSRPPRRPWRSTQSNAEAHWVLGTVYAALLQGHQEVGTSSDAGDLDRAILHLEQARPARPYDLGLVLTLGRLYLAKGDHDKAIEALDWVGVARAWHRRSGLPAGASVRRRRPADDAAISHAARDRRGRAAIPPGLDVDGRPAREGRASSRRRRRPTGRPLGRTRGPASCACDRRRP